MDLTVGLEGSGADRIVSGTAEDEINQAIADVGAAGGGSVSLLQGTYSLATGILIEHDNVTLQGAGAGQTVLQAIAGYPAGVPLVQAFQADNVTIQGLTVDGHTNNAHANPIVTAECTNGVIAECEVKLSENHNYGIWLVLSDGMQVLDNYVDGVTPTAGQEAIETWSSQNLLISGNTVANIGGGGIVVGSAPAPAFGDFEGHTTNIRVLNNTVTHSYIGASVVLAGPRSLGQIEIQGNTFTDIAYGVRLLVDRWEGEGAELGDAQSLHDIDISGNQINLVSDSGSGMLLQNNLGPGVVSFSNISAYGNVISNAPGAIFGIYDFDNFTLDDNVMTGAAQQVGGSPYDDMILGSNLANLLSGDAGADTFVFDANALTPAYSGAKVVDRILDYNQGNSGTYNSAEGDAIDLSALLSAGVGQWVGNLVRVVESRSGTIAVVQVDRDGTANGTNWTTVALLDGVSANAGIKVVYDSSQPAVTLSIQADVPFNFAPEVDLPAGDNISAAKAQTIQVSSLFTGSDLDGDTLTYYLYDSSTGGGSGYFRVGSNILAAQTIHQLSAAQFAQAIFVAGAAGVSDAIYVQTFDGISYSGWNAGVTVSVPANRAPTVGTPSGSNISAGVAKTLQVSSLFTGSDLDGDALTYYLYDTNAAANSGYFVVGGVKVPAQTIYALTAAQFAQATFVSGAAGVADDILVQAFDGTAYSGWNTHVNVNVVNNAPIVTAPQASVTIAAGQSRAVSSLFSSSDSDGDALTYYLYDTNAAANSGYFVVGGVKVPAQTIYALTATQFAQATFVSGAGGVADDILVQAFDGATYSGWNTSVGVTSVANRAPVMTAVQANVTAPAGQSIALANQFTASDPDGDPMTFYVYDSNPAANSGYIVVDGVTVPAETIHAMTAAQFAQATFVTGAGGIADDIYVQVSDGKIYSGWNTSVHFTAEVPFNNLPVVQLPQGGSVTATAGQSIAVASLFSGNDVDGDALSYYLYDSNTAANSGYFVVDGITVPAQTIYALTAAQFAQATFVAGTAGLSDDILVQAFDGKGYSGWNTSVNVSVPAPVNNVPTVSLPAGANVTKTPGESVAVSSLFNGSDLDGDTLSYYLYDANDAANSGHLEVGGVTVAAQTIYAISAAELAQTTYISGADGTSDSIFVQAFDGKAYSGWNAGVIVTSVAPNNAPTVSLPSGTSFGASAGQTVQLSDLFAGSDLDGDTLSYFVYDNNAAADSGHVEIGGNVVAAQTITAMTAAELAQATFVAGDVGTADGIFVQAFDGKAYSGWASGVHIFV